MNIPRILIVDGPDSQHQDLKRLLLQQKFDVVESDDTTAAFRVFHDNNPDLVILKSFQNDMRASFAFVRKIRKIEKRIPIIMITASDSEEIIINALRIGIKDYFKYPFNKRKLLESVNRCLSVFFNRKNLRKDKTSNVSLVQEEKIIGRHPLMEEVKTYIEKVALTDSSVLITGETGTGKELVAELIHKNSERKQKPFLCINCTAIPDTLLESELFGHEKGAFTGAHATQEGKLRHGDGGTIFFDEIGDMSLSNQAKILRVIESKEVQRLGGKSSLPLDIRFIAATNQDLEQLVADGKFRKDLYFRINVARIHLPSLRERKEDIPLLLDAYIKELNQKFIHSVEGFTEEVMDYLLGYCWPGNIRELKNLLEALFINLNSRWISFADLPVDFREQLEKLKNISGNEQEQLLSALLSTSWNISKAAKKLHWSRMTVYRKMEKYHIKKSM